MGIITIEARLSIVEEVIVNRKEVSEIAQKFSVSKSAIIKLIKSYNEGVTEWIGINLCNKSLDLK